MSNPYEKIGEKWAAKQAAPSSSNPYSDLPELLKKGQEEALKNPAPQPTNPEENAPATTPQTLHPSSPVKPDQPVPLSNPMDNVFNKAKEEYPVKEVEIETSPWKDEWTTWDQIWGGLARFSEETFLFGHDAWDIDEDPRMNPIVTQGASIAGLIANQIGVGVATGGLGNLAIKSAQGLAILTKATRTAKGIQWLNSLRTGSRAGSLAYKAGGTILKGGFEGLLYSGAYQFLAPQERKPGIAGTVENLATFGGGELGARIGLKAVKTFLPKASPVAEKLLMFTGDLIGSTTLGLGVVQDTDRFLDQQFSTQVVAIGVIDLALYSWSKGRLQRIPDVDALARKLSDLDKQYQRTENANLLPEIFSTVSKLMEAGTPEGSRSSAAFAQDFIDQLQLDLDTDIRTQMKAIQQSLLENVGKVGYAEQLPVNKPNGKAPLAIDQKPVLPESEAVQQPVPTGSVDLTGDSIARAYWYPKHKAKEIGDYLQTLSNAGQEAGFETDFLAALAKVESDFRDVGNLKSSAQGILQVTDTALKDLKRLGIPYDVSTTEGRIEAGISYLKVLRDHYKLSGDKLVAAYFSGPTYVKKHGIDNKVQYGQHSNREYVNRHKKALADLQNPPGTRQVTAKDLKDPRMLQLALSDLGYYQGNLDGDLGPLSREAIRRFQQDRGLKVDGDVGPKTFAALLPIINNLWAKPSAVQLANQDLQKAIEAEQQAAAAAMEPGPTPVLTPVNPIKAAEMKPTPELIVKAPSAHELPLELKTIAEKANKEIARASELIQKEAAAALKESPQVAQRVASEVVRTDIHEKGRQTKEVLASTGDTKYDVNDPAPFSKQDILAEGGVNKIMEWLTNREGSLSPEEVQRLRTEYRPRNGYPLNTTRYTMEVEALNAWNQLATVMKDSSTKPLSEVEAKAYTTLESAKAKDADAIANELNLAVEDAKILEQVLKTADEKLTRFRAVVGALAVDVQTDADRIGKMNPLELSDLDAAKFAYKVEMQKSLTGSLLNIGTGASRLLGSLRVIVGPEHVSFSDLTPQHLRNSIDAQDKVTQILDAHGGKESIISAAKEIAEAPDLAAINKKVAQKSEPKVIKALVEQAAASKLTNPRTPITNVMAQLFHWGQEHLNDFVAAGIGTLRRNPDRMTTAEAKARFMADSQGMLTAFTRPMVSTKDVAGFQHLEKAPSLVDILSLTFQDPQKLESLLAATSLDSRMKAEGYTQAYFSRDYLKGTGLEKTVSKTADKVVSLLKLDGNRTGSEIAWNALDKAASVHRLLGYGAQELGDRPFSQGAYLAELAGRLERMRNTLPETMDNGMSRNEYLSQLHEQVVARRKEKTLEGQIKTAAIESGLTGKDLELKKQEMRTKATEGKLDGLDENQLKLIDELDNQAIQYSKAVTWKDPIESKVLRDVELLLGKHPSLRFLIPFYHTPVRILEYVAKTTPGVGAIVNKKMRDDIRGLNGERARDMALAQWTVGGLLYGLGGFLAAANLVTPTAGSEDERRRMIEAGIPENSIRVGNTWIDINKFDPAPATYFNLMANVVKALRDREDEDTVMDVASNALFSITRGVLDKTWLTSVKTTVDAVTGIGSERWASTMVDSALPLYGLRQAVKSWPVGDLNPAYNDHIMEANSFVEKYLPKQPALDTFGNPIDNYSHILGVRYSKPNGSPIRQELMNLGMTLGKPSRVVNGVRLNDEQYWKMRNFLSTGLNAEQKMNEFIASQMYQQSTAEVRRRMLRQYWSALLSATRNVVYNDPEYLSAWKELTERRKNKLLDRSETPDWFS